MLDAVVRSNSIIICGNLRHLRTNGNWLRIRSCVDQSDLAASHPSMCGQVFFSAPLPAMMPI